jgi:hypothetical protein
MKYLYCVCHSERSRGISNSNCKKTFELFAQDRQSKPRHGRLTTDHVRLRRRRSCQGERKVPSKASVRVNCARSLRGEEFGDDDSLGETPYGKHPTLNVRRSTEAQLVFGIASGALETEVFQLATPETTRYPIVITSLCHLH